MGSIDTIMKNSKTVIKVSEKMVKTLDKTKAKILGDNLTKISKTIKELNRKLTDNEENLIDECEIVKSGIREIENISGGEFDFLDKLIELFEYQELIDELNNAPKKAIMALKLGRASSYFGIAGEILRGEL